MSHARVLLTAIIVALLVAGCNHQEREVPKGSELGGPDFEGRLDAAKAMTDPWQRDIAYSSIASDSTRWYNVTIATYAVEQISDEHICDVTATDSARWYNQKQMKESAQKFAKQIKDPALREEILREIATNLKQK